MARKDIGRQLEDFIRRKIKPKLDLNDLSKRDLEDLSDLTIEEMKKAISKGQTTIEGGKRRFPAYKNPENYPDKIMKHFPKKRRRPVNLNLSGKFLSKLSSKVETQKRKFGLVTKRRVRIGFFDQLSKKKEQGHREGANGQPKRPIIPTRSESFSKRILTKVRKEYIKKVKRIFDKN